MFGDTFEREGIGEKIGAGVEEIAEFASPGTWALKTGKVIQTLNAFRKLPKIGKVLGGATRVAGEGAIFGGVKAVQEGTINESVKMDAMIGMAFPLLGQGWNAVKGGIPKLMQFTTQIPEGAFKTLLERGSAVSKEIKGKITPQETLKDTQKAVVKLRENLSNEWKDGVKSIKEEFKNQSIPLPKSLANKLFQIGEEFRFFDTPTNLKSIQVNKAINLYNDVNQLLKQREVREGATGIGVRKLRDELKGFMVNNFGGKDGSIDRLFQNYSAKIDIFNQVDDLAKAFKTSSPKIQASAEANLQKIFDESKVAYLDAVKGFENITGVDILSKVAAQKFTPIVGKESLLPSVFGKGGLINKILNSLLLPITSPRGAKKIIEATQKPPTSGLGQRLFGELDEAKGSLPQELKQVGSKLKKNQAGFTTIGKPPDKLRNRKTGGTYQSLEDIKKIDANTARLEAKLPKK